METSLRNKSPRGYAKLSSTMVRRLNETRIAVYYWDGITEHPVLYRDAEVVLDEQAMEHSLAERGDSLFVRNSDFSNACAALIESLGDIANDDSIDPAERFQLIQMAVSFEVERTLKAVDPGEYVELVTDVSNHISRLVSENKLLPNELFAIARHDSQTFSHVTNVAGYATMLAERLSICGEDELNELAIGAMLHDMGKRSIPNSIIAKPGRLTDEEMAVMRTHTTLGYEELYLLPDLTHAQLMMVYQHHEHMDGNGYPVRVLGDEIHPWARLLAVVDVFDALTGSRPYRKPMPLNKAADFIADRAGKQFDEEMAKCWVSTIRSK